MEGYRWDGMGWTLSTRASPPSIHPVTFHFKMNSGAAIQVINNLQEKLSDINNIMTNINYDKHPSEKAWCEAEILNTYNLALSAAHEKTLELLAKYVTRDYLTWPIPEETKEV